MHHTLEKVKLHLTHHPGENETVMTTLLFQEH